MKHFFYVFTPVIFIFSFVFSIVKDNAKKALPTDSSASLVILGNVQDGGSPHIACAKSCCRDLFTHPDSNRKVVSIGLIDSKYQKIYIFEATPDFTIQIKDLKKLSTFNAAEIPDGIFLTHAHIGHYTGLMYLGKEAVNANKVAVYAMPRMKLFLENNGPWSQLVALENISLKEMHNEKPITLTPDISVKPFIVPHRDEFSETIGYLISGTEKSALFIPDIDKWAKWDKSIIDEVKKVDYAFVDATFYDGEEINYRDIAQIPHPFVIESMALFKDLAPEQKSKIHFIHFNHTNPLLKNDSKQSREVLKNGFNIAKIYDVYTL